MSHRGPRLLLVGGLCSAAIALLHLVMIFVGAPAYRYFGAGESLAKLAESGSALPALLTAFIAAVFAVFSWSGLAGAALAPRPRLLRAGLIAIAAIFLLRGALALPQLAAILLKPETVALRDFVFSLASLLIGLCYAMGGWSRRKTP